MNRSSWVGELPVAGVGRKADLHNLLVGFRATVVLRERVAGRRELAAQCGDGLAHVGVDRGGTELL